MGPTRVSIDSTTLPLAVWSFFANRMVDVHVRTAYAYGEMLRKQARTGADMSSRMGTGALRDAVNAWAGAHEMAADVVTDAAKRWGRRHGHLMFAVPVPSVDR